MRILQSIMNAIAGQKEPASAELVRQRAYELWEENGRPESDGIEFWLKAEKELTKGKK